MAVEKQMSSVKPTPPKSPPAVKPGKGESGQAGVPYGANMTMSIKSPSKSEMAHHFTSNDGGSGKAGREESNEGPKAGEKSGKPGYK